ncbi:RNA polymerase sigma factor [bacterium 1XD42-8]|jgi:RNA polymerase sigma factor (sigma-70 family)|nr:RNA polymerase sigma factor [Lachnospiraceae bacterium]RKJ52373.1 RNA polymerase sigma factor [bacterium 1XD42-8]
MEKSKIDEIYRKHATMIYKYLWGLAQDTQLAEELTQETFFQAIKGIDKFRGDCKVSTWLCQIAKNLWYKELERRNKHKTVELNDSILSNENVEYYCLNHMEKIEIFRLMHKLLDEATREVMYLRLGGDLHFSEIADILGKTENWARVTYYRGKQKIMKGMKEWTEN